jgi:hypothetical protein
MDDEQEYMDRERQLAKSAEQEPSGWNRWRRRPIITCADGGRCSHGASDERCAYFVGPVEG